MQDDDDDSAHYIMADGDVHLITTVAAWEERLSLANQQDKIVRFLPFFFVGNELSAVFCASYRYPFTREVETTSKVPFF